MKKDRTEELWITFADRFKLTKKQLEQFQTYARMLVQWNEKFNLTGITELPGIISSHFTDSMAVSDEVPLERTIIDVGSGAGFPALPLKILNPNLKFILIEVTAKRRTFLHALIAELGLQDIEVCDLDWRTFVRTTETPDIGYVLARASLDPVELCRMFSPISAYNEATLIYWAADEYEVPEKIKKYFLKEVPYRLKRKKRKLVFFKRR